MFCHKCGAKLVNEAEFCSICGTKVQPPAPITTVNSNIQPQDPNSSANKVAPKEFFASTPQSDTDEYRDYICPNCGETVSYRPEDAPNHKFICPMCDHQFLISFHKPHQSPSNTDINHHSISEAGAQYRAYYEQSVVKPIASSNTPGDTNIRPRTITSHSMGWHKFLIYFSLWVGGIGNIIGGIVYLVGGQYMTVNPYTGELFSYRSRVYEYYEGLRGIDIAMGIAFIATGIMFAIARNALANYKENALKLLMVAYGNAIADNVVSAIIGTKAISSTFVISLIGSIVMTVVNYIYYKNREYMFYN